MDLLFVLYYSIWLIPAFYPFILTILFQRAFPQRINVKIVFIPILLVFLDMLWSAVSNIFTLTIYGGIFQPTMDLILGRFYLANVIVLNVLLAMVFIFIIGNQFKPLLEEIDIGYGMSGYLINNKYRWLLSGSATVITILILEFTIPNNIAYSKRVLDFITFQAMLAMIVFYIGMAILLSIKLGQLLMSYFESLADMDALVNRIMLYSTVFIFTIGVITFVIGYLLSIALISGKEMYLPIIYYAIIIIALILILLIPNILSTERFSNLLDLSPRRDLKFVEINSRRAKHLTISVFLIISVIIPLIAVPIMMTFPSLERSKLALNTIEITDDPVAEYPVNLTNIRVVTRSLAADISLSRLPSPPKGYSLSVLSEYEVIGIIDGRPAWIIPMRYESFFNKETNILAGYMAVYLDDPIPEHIVRKFVEMKAGPGLNGFRDISWIASQAKPTSRIGEINFIDPYWDTEEPAWILVMDTFNEWGLRIPDQELLVVHINGSYEAITIQDALDAGFPEVNSETSIKIAARNAGQYLRNGQFDETANGLVTIPPSSDRSIDLESETTTFYLDTHHFLLNNNTWFGRLYYQKATTGDRESIMVWAAINGTIKLYDLREYSRGGAVGVNTPDSVTVELQNEIYSSFTGIANYYLQQPTLYKTLIDNTSTLVWVSLIIQSKQGSDELVGAAFIDAANTRIVGFKERKAGENYETFKARLIESIEITYQSFGTEAQAGESETLIINNGTVLSKEWTGFDLESRKTYVIKVRDNDDLEEYYLVVKWTEAGTGADYYRAAACLVGEHYFFKARFDKDEQVFVVINCQEI